MIYQIQKKLISTLKKFGFDISEFSTNIFLQKDQIFRMGNPPIRIKILTSVSGVTFDKCYEERVEDYFDGLK